MAGAIGDSVKQLAENVKNLATSDKPPKQQGQKPQGQKKEKKKSAAPGGQDELSTPPPYFDHRIQLFEKLKAEEDAEYAKKPRKDIQVTMPDGNIRVATSYETTPGSIARDISKSLFERLVISEVDGELWDLDRPLETDCTLKLLDFDDPKGKQVFWHSSAHILGEASEKRFGCDLCIGPPISDGFYYEMSLPEGAAVQETDLEPLERIANKVIKEKQPFVRLTLSKENLLEMFKSNRYKQHIIKDKIADGTSTTVYRCGPLIDLCRGPHVPHTGRIKVMKVMRSSASYFLGDAKNDSLQRIYGVSFPDKKLMDAHLKMLEEAARRDHRRIGKDQELFFFHDMSPGSAFLLPHGMSIFNTLQSFIRSEYWTRGYTEVSSPNMYNASLWKQSGHWQHYQDDMFVLDVDKDKWGLKPMNCPGHCLLFAFTNRTYHDLPLRIAEFGVLHRNEASGALSGLTRVRRFVQDDCHIFCMQDQIGAEMANMFNFFETVYGTLGLTFKMKLSTRPDNFLGEIETWDEAEKMLTDSLNEFCKSGTSSWELNPGDGAFYGPKIDITVGDALGRDFQCATIQLDYQLPQRFNLTYITGEKTEKPAEKSADKSVAPVKPEETVVSAAEKEAAEKADEAKGIFKIKPLQPGYARPIIIHRAIYGSFERFLGILIEHFAGKWPFWLSPRQILVVPVMPSANEYVLEVQKIFREKGMHVDSDISGNTLQKKIRTGQLAQYNFIFVVGAEEMKSRTVNIRNRDDQEKQSKGELIPLDEAIEKLTKLRDSRQQVNAI
ncbi:threonyl-tRNA synthetase [Microthyrium microscopicum]|uniref:threonine--tRNA ligase n=1 Tax=Microthyrium microscopicum TaxID=703497 RepID=A0A6A6TZJ6_9PEZI|nr:threonyl-tRNA synthetase [Microthyrium microscopicum]